MVSIQLINDMESYLLKAEEVWVAVALMKDDALDELLARIPKNASKNFLIGIDLPTSPSALRKLQNLESSNVKVGIIKEDTTFHPKAYIIRTQQETVSFVGSANLTLGGLRNNTELSIKTDDSSINNALLDWFNKKQKDSYPLTDSNLNQYESQFKAIEKITAANSAELPKLKLEKLVAHDPFGNMDFTDRFFKREHHLAFRGELWEKRTSAAEKERVQAFDRFLELHDIIYPQFEDFGLTNLFCHNNKENIVSHYYHVDGYTSKQLDSMWLSYGKSEKAIAKYQSTYEPGLKKLKDKQRSLQTFSHHARLQIRIEQNLICLWLFFGKKNGSAIDRGHFRNRMIDDAFRNRFFAFLKKLPEGYYISLSRDTWKLTSSFQDADQLHDFCKMDRPENHFYIGKDYEIGDPLMSEHELPKTVLTEFQRLYPIYNLMRDSQFG